MSRRQLHLSCVLALVSLTLGLAPQPRNHTALQLQTGPWSQPVRLSDARQSSWFPDVAADQRGNVHVVWSSDLPGFDTVMYTTSSDGRSWLAPIDIVAYDTRLSGRQDVTRPALLFDSAGQLHLTSRGGAETFIYYTYATAPAISAASLAPGRNLSSPLIGYFSRPTQDALGRLHVLFTGQVLGGSCRGCYHLFHLSSSDGGRSWSAPVDISLRDGAAKPQMVTDEAGRLYVVWETGQGGDLGNVTEPNGAMFAASADGVSWSAPVALSSGTEDGLQQAKQVALGRDGRGRLIVAWLSLPSDRVVYRVSADQGATWSPARTIAGVWGRWSVYPGNLDAYSMATDSAGDVHLALVGRTSEFATTLSVMTVTWNGERWSSAGVIASLQGDVPEWPRLAVGLGNQLHLTWFVRDQAHLWDSDEGQYSVWYARGAADAPPIAAPPLASPMATPTATITPSPASPEPTARPTAGAFSSSPISPGWSGSIKSEMDDVLILAISLSPAVLLIGLFLAGVRLRRR